jgi:hypothetical protein
MGSVFEATGAIGLYTRRLPWDDLRGSHLQDSGERPYCLAKTMFMMYSRVLAEKLRGTGVDVFAGEWVTRRWMPCDSVQGVGAGLGLQPRAGKVVYRCC